MTKQRFDIAVCIRGSYKSKFGQVYLTLQREYEGLIGSRLIKRALIDNHDLIILKRAERKAQIEEEEKRLQAEKLRLKTGGI